MPEADGLRSASDDGLSGEHDEMSPRDETSEGANGSPEVRDGVPPTATVEDIAKELDYDGYFDTSDKQVTGLNTVKRRKLALKALLLLANDGSLDLTVQPGDDTKTCSFDHLKKCGGRATKIMHVLLAELSDPIDQSVGRRLHPDMKTDDDPESRTAANRAMIESSESVLVTHSEFSYDKRASITDYTVKSTIFGRTCQKTRQEFILKRMDTSYFSAPTYTSGFAGMYRKPAHVKAFCLPCYGQNEYPPDTTGCLGAVQINAPQAPSGMYINLLELTMHDYREAMLPGSHSLTVAGKMTFCSLGSALLGEIFAAYEDAGINIMQPADMRRAVGRLSAAVTDPGAVASRARNLLRAPPKSAGVIARTIAGRGANSGSFSKECSALAAPPSTTSITPIVPANQKRMRDTTPMLPPQRYSPHGAPPYGFDKKRKRDDMAQDFDDYQDQDMWKEDDMRVYESQWRPRDARHYQQTHGNTSHGSTARPQHSNYSRNPFNSSSGGSHRR